MGEVTWVEIYAGGQLPGALGQVVNGLLKQGREQAGDGHQVWLPGVSS